MLDQIHRARTVLCRRQAAIQSAARPRTLWLAAAVTVLLVALGASALVPGSSSPPPVPTPTATPAPASTTTASSPSASVSVIDDLATDSELFTPATLAGPYRSRVNPWVTFDLYCAGANCRDPFVGELCPPRVMPGSIELPHAKSCRDSVSVIRPDSVDCRNSVDVHPDAAKLARILLSNEPLHVVDLGNVGSSTPVGTDLFLEPYQGRVIQILGGPTPRTVDPVLCILRLDPSLGLPPIEVRSDTASTLVLVDVESSLFVVRAAAQAGGASPNLFLQGHLLNLIHHIRFVL